MHCRQTGVVLSRRQILSRVNRLAVAPDFEMQPRLAFRPLTHGRYALAFIYGLAFFDQQRLVVPVGTKVGVVMFQDNKLAIADKSTAGVDNPARCSGTNGLTFLAVDQNASSGARFAAELDIDLALRWPAPRRRWLSRDRGQWIRRPSRRRARRGSAAAWRRQTDSIARVNQRTVAQLIPTRQVGGNFAIAPRE